MTTMMTSARSSFNHRRGMSLLELLAVVTLLGIFSTAVVARYGRSLFGDSGVRSGARMLSLGILEAQRGAIRTGNTHAILFQGTSSAVQSWSVIQIDPQGGRTLVDGPHEIPADYSLTVNTSEILFDFEGNGLDLLSAQFQGPNRRWELQVLPMTRMIQSQEVQ